MRHYQGQGLVFNFHGFEESTDLGHHFEVILEEIGFKHGIEIFRYLFTFMETTFEVISNLGNIRYIDIFVVLVIITREIKINLLAEEVFQEKVHQLTILFLFKVIIIEHGY